LRGFFRPLPDAPAREAGLIPRLAARWRASVFLSITLGYTVFYVTRLPMSVAKDPMIAGGAITIAQAAILDTAFLWSYAVGKTVNGFLADRVSIRRFFATALLVSALANLVFGLSSIFVVFALLWVANGWVQSVGVPASGVAMAAWFTPTQLGTRYSIWSLAHHLGEGLTFIVTAQLIGATGSWRAAFIGPALLGTLSAIILYRSIADRPAAVGLPAVATVATKKSETLSLGASQLGVLKNPTILVCGLASSLVYVARYAINNWGVFYLQKQHAYSIEEAGALLSIFPLAGIAGTLLAGPISDRLVGGRRVPVAVAYGTVFCIAMACFYSSPSPVLLHISLVCGGFGMGGLLVFLGGLLAMELCDRRVAGAALGVIGGLSYLGAGLQSFGSGHLIAAGATTTAGITSYDFTGARMLWLAAPCIALVLTASLWRAEQRAKAARRDAA
jgi:OPA family sugar phosphate sensor protein UhpC-like MFS transporter